MLYFITGNKGKLGEIQTLLPEAEIEGLDIDLPELQEIDAKKIIEAKLHEATAHHDGAFIVEDTSLYLDSLNGLPGPLIKWFMKTVGNDGLSDVARKLENSGAQAKTIIGYAGPENNIHYFEGLINGQIVPPRGENGFGWDAIFQPDGSTKTFAEMTSEEKNTFSMRKRAATQLADYLAQ
jgi:inosine triphosphate pyrophosphatase